MISVSAPRFSFLVLSIFVLVITFVLPQGHLTRLDRAIAIHHRHVRLTCFIDCSQARHKLHLLAIPLYLGIPKFLGGGTTFSSVVWSNGRTRMTLPVRKSISPNPAAKSASFVTRGPMMRCRPLRILQKQKDWYSPH